MSDAGLRSYVKEVVWARSDGRWVRAFSTVMNAMKSVRAGSTKCHARLEPGQPPAPCKDTVDEEMADVAKIGQGTDGLVFRVSLTQHGGLPAVLKVSLVTAGGQDGEWHALDGEYYDGLHVNRLLRRVPNYALTYSYNLYPVVDVPPSGQRPGHQRIGGRFDDAIAVRGGMLMQYIGGTALTNYVGSVDRLDGVGAAAKQVAVASHLVQVLLALEVAQREMEFVHYDLHTDNVMLEPLPEPSWFVYHLDGREYWLFTTHRAVIIDYGRMSRLREPREAAQRRRMGLRAERQEISGYERFNVHDGVFNGVWDAVTLLRSTIGLNCAASRQSLLCSTYFLRLYRILDEEFQPAPRELNHYGVMRDASRSVHDDGRAALSSPLDLAEVMMDTDMWRENAGDESLVLPVYHWGYTTGGARGLADGRRTAAPHPAGRGRIRINLDDPVTEEERVYVADKKAWDAHVSKLRLERPASPQAKRQRKQ